MATVMLQRSRFEEGRHGAFAFRALHALHIAINDESGTAFGSGSDGRRTTDPDSLALVTHDGLAGATGGAKYYFTDNFGVYAEVGYGIGNLMAGATFKF